MGDMNGRTVLITGANTGIGRATAVDLGARGATLFLACRSEAKAQPVIDQIRAAGNDDVRFLPLDLADLASVRDCAEAFLEDADRPLHVLINNAGLAGKPGLTEQGFQLTFGVNHLGHFLLTELLLERLKASAPARIVNVASKAHYRAEGVDFDRLRTPTTTARSLPDYNVSKLCNVLHAKQLARRLEGAGVTTYSLHPGVIASDVWRNVPWPFRAVMKLFMKSNEEGAQTTLHCATSDAAAEQSGRYYEERAPKEPNPLAHDPALQDALDAKSREWVADFMGRSSTATAPADAAADSPPGPR